MSDRSSTLQEAILRAVENGIKNLYTCIPAKVVKWDAGKQRADCQILVKDFYEDETGERRTESWAVVTGVPVQFLGAGGFRVTCPISDGSGGQTATTGTLFFAHRSLDKWLTGTGGEVDPEFDHDHALGDAIFMPGLMPFGSPWQDVPSDGMSIGKDGGLQMKVTDSLITLAETAGNAQFVALANLVKSELDSIQAALTTHTHSGVTAGVATTGASNSTYVASQVAASKVKAE